MRSRFRYDEHRVRQFALIVIAALVVMTVVTLIVIGARSRQAETRQATPAQPIDLIAPLEGPLKVVSVDTFSIGSQRFHLCGITQKNPANRALTTSILQTAFNGRKVRCMQSGSGTACDGQTTPTRGGEPLMHCVNEAGLDLAATLVERGLFCGTIEAPGYRRC